MCENLWKAMKIMKKSDNMAYIMNMKIISEKNRNNNEKIISENEKRNNERNKQYQIVMRK